MINNHGTKEDPIDRLNSQKEEAEWQLLQDQLHELEQKKRKTSELIVHRDATLSLFDQKQIPLKDQQEVVKMTLKVLSKKVKPDEITH